MATEDLSYPMQAEAVYGEFPSEETVSDNLAETLNDETLKKIGRDAVVGFEADEDSRGEWVERNEQWHKLAAQVTEVKNTPWPNASNVKYPLLTTAVGAFAARAYPAMVSGHDLVRGVVIGRDRTGDSSAKADRIGKHMSYQLMCQMPGWEDDHDRMCYVAGLIGNAFKKTYFCQKTQKNVSELILPKDLVVHYLSKSIESAPRKTHVMLFSRNDVETMKRRGFFLDVKLGDPETTDKYNDLPEVQGVYAATNDDTKNEYTILEQHTYLDIDEDGYEEPVIIWVEKESKNVLRIAKRYDEKNVEENEQGEVVHIEPDECFTNYVFVPDMESGVYGFGLGNMIGPINEASNTMLNMLVDAGKLSNLQSGFIGKGAKITAGSAPFRPGEWRLAQVSGDDIKKNIFPLPVKEPSNVLFTAFQTLIGAGEKLSSITDIFSGELPGQNTPATVVMTAVDQGTKVFNSIYKRLHRSFNKELKKLFKLNGKYLPEYEYFNPQGQQNPMPELIFKGDYDEEAYDVIPTADPHVSSDAQQLAKAQALMNLIPLGTVNPQVVTLRMLEAMKMPQIDQLMNVKPQPNPEFELKKYEIDKKYEVEMLKLQIEASRTESQNSKDMAKTIGDLMKADQTSKETQMMGHGVMMDLTDKIHRAKELTLQEEKNRNDANRKTGVES